MKLKLFIIIIAIQIICAFSIGCINNNKIYTLEDFVGTWYAAEIPDISNGSNIPIEYTWIFYINNSMRSEIFFQNETSNYSVKLWYNCIIEDSNLCISLINETINETSLQCFSFEFSENKNRFVLIQNEIPIITFEKLK